MIQEFIESRRAGQSRLGRMDARVKLLLALTWVVCIVVTPLAHWHRLAAYGVLLLALYVVARVPPMWVLGRFAVLLPFLLLITVSLPFVPRDEVGQLYRLPHTGLTVSGAGLRAFGSVTSKSLLCLLVMTLLAATTRFEDTLKALQQLRAPAIFVTLMSFMLRYLFVLGDEAQRMIRARDSRGKVRELRRRVRVAGSMIGTLFVRSYERSERVAMAMVARGFDGTVRVLAQGAARPWDAVAGTLFAGLLVCVAVAPL
jgi:cobalt/nickel transport system permease protein